MCRLLFIALLFLLGPGPHPAAAQARPPAYAFMTLTLLESSYRTDSRLLFTPAFKGQSEVKLEEIYNLSSDRYRTQLQRNTDLVNKALEELSDAGWELLSVQATMTGATPTASITRYLLRRPRP